jgi:hypothetical protein
MRKKLFILFAALVPATAAMADEDRPVSLEQLPAAAQKFIATHFSDSKVMLATMDRDFFTTWDVIFDDGTQVEFDSRGEWKEIDCRKGFVPEAVVPAKIASYLRENHPQAHVRSMERDGRYTEVNLDNHIELTFDGNGTLREVDF